MVPWILLATAVLIIAILRGPRAVIQGGHPIEGSSAQVYRYGPVSPALGTSTAVLAATAAASASVVTTGITNPDVPRNVTATPGGTTANVTAVQVIVTGTDANGSVITETLPAFSAGAATAVTGSKAFRTITSISLPATGASVTIAIGLGAKLGLPMRLSYDSVMHGFLNGVREATRPVATVNASVVESNTVTLTSALNGNPVVIDFVA